MAARKYNPGYSFSSSESLSQRDRERRDYDQAGHRPCSRQPPELCESARTITLDDGSTRREPGLTPRAFCDPCQDRIINCLEQLPVMYQGLAARIGDPARTGVAVRVPPGSRVLLNPEIDALLRVMAAILAGWYARVRRVPGLQLSDPQHQHDTPAGVAEACDTLAKHATPLLALQAKWTTRTFTYLPAAPVAAHETTCRRCGYRISPGRPPREGEPPAWWLAERPAGPLPPCDHDPADPDPPERRDVIPDVLLEVIGDREIIRQGDGWLDVQDHLDGADAGNEILGLHWRARKLLGWTRPAPESFDGVPCQNCDEMALERAEPPSDPDIPADHSKCALCKHTMSREVFDQWAERYAAWARGAGVQECRRCGQDNHGECSWAACSCSQGDHPRRRAAA